MMAARTIFLLSFFFMTLPGAVLWGFEVPYRKTSIALVGVIGALLFVALTLRPRIRFDRSLLAAVIALWAVFVIGFAKGLTDDAVTRVDAMVQLVIWSGVTAGGITYFGCAPRPERGFLHLVYGALFVFVTVNLLFIAVGVGGPETGARAAMLNALGLDQVRQSSPLGGGINSFGLVAGALLAAGTFLLLKRRRGMRRRYALAGAAAGLAGVLVADSRAALILGVLAALVMLAHRRAAWVMPGAIALTIILPLAAVAGLVSGDVLPDSISRSGDVREVASFTGRLYMWDAAVAYLADPSIEHITGAGYKGHLQTGIAEAYAREGQTTPPPVHNAMLQTLVDSGYVGLSVLVVCILAVTMGLLRLNQVKRDNLPRMASAVLIYLVLLGGTEYTLTPYSRVPTTLFIFLMCAVAREVADISLASEPRPLITRRALRPLHEVT